MTRQIYGDDRLDTIEDKPAPLPRDEFGLPSTYVPPQNAIERTLEEIWRGALGVDRVGIDDDFFDLAGDSLSAVTIAAAVSEAFGLDFKPSLIMGQRTIRLMAEKIGASHARDLPLNVVLARASDSRPPLFLIHGQYGITFLPPQFMEGFRDDQPIYVFQVPGLDGSVEPHDRVEEIAADYLQTMLEIQKQGPYFIAAFCAGSWIAIEMMNQMRQQGLTPDRLILMDPALHSAMDDEFLVNRGRISGGNIPVISRLVSSVKLGASDTFRRTKFLFRTGHWVNGQDHASFAIPSVQRFWIDRQRERLDTDQLKSIVASKNLVAGSDIEPTSGIGKSNDGNAILQATAYASAKLQLAFRTYRPIPCDVTVDLIVSEKTARSLTNLAHPINRVLPNRRLIVFGKTHGEAVAGSNPRNARLIQEMLDETQLAASETPPM